MDPKENATAWHDQQRQRATARPPFRPEIPQDHRCPAGACSQTPPPPPPGTEPFTTAQATPFAWYATMATATLLFVFLTRSRRIAGN